MQGEVLIMMDMRTKNVYRFVSGRLVGVLDHDSVYHGSTTEEIILTPLHPIYSDKDDMVHPVSDVVPPRDDRFLREMMMQCMDDMCSVGFENLMIDIENTAETSVTIQSTVRHSEVGMEWNNPVTGFLTMFRMASDSSMAVMITAGCLVFTMEADSNVLPNFIIMVMKGVTIVGSGILAKSSLTMTVIPTIGNAIAQGATNIGAMTLYDPASSLYHSNLLPSITRHVASWTIRGVLVKGCVAPLVVNGAMVVYNKIMNGNKYVNDPKEGYMHAIARENTDLIIGTINDTVDGILDSKPLSNGVKNMYSTVIVAGIGVTAAIVLINQSQHPWFAYGNNRPKKRTKREEVNKKN